MFVIEGIKTRLTGRFKPTFREVVYSQLSGLFFLIMPTRVFIGISSDILQIAVIIVPFVIAFMVLLLTIDPTFNLPIPADAVEKVSDRRQQFSDPLVVLLHLSLKLAVLTIIGKALAVCFIDCGWLALIVNHFVAWIVGMMFALLVTSINDIRSIFGYLSVAAQFAFAVRARREG